MSIKGIIFDFDGVLCNSEFLHKEAFKLALNSLGYSWCFNKEKVYESYTTTQIITIGLPLLILLLFGVAFTFLRKKKYSK